MKEYNLKKVISSEKGITLVTLVITVVVMLIIIGISINSGTESLDNTRLQGFYMQLETIQKRVDDIVSTNEGYYINNVDGTKTYIDLKTAGGSAITSSQSTLLQSILNSEGITTSASEFRYFTITDLNEQLDLNEIDYNVFIHFDTRTVIAENGITINGEKFYVLRSNMYYPEYDSDKNIDTKAELDLEYDIKKYGSNSNKYKITVTPKNTVGDLNIDGTLRYKLTTTKYWEIANGLEIIVSELTQYNVEYVDNNNNSVSETIVVSLNDAGNPTVTAVQE